MFFPEPSRFRLIGLSQSLGDPYSALRDLLSDAGVSLQRNISLRQLFVYVLVRSVTHVGIAFVDP